MPFNRRINKVVHKTSWTLLIQVRRKKERRKNIMNKLFTKIVGAALGLTMAIGVGVAVGSNREAAPVEASSSSSSAPTNATYSHVFSSGQLKVTSTGTATLSNITWNTTCANTSAYLGWDAIKGIQLGSGTSGKTIQSGYTISTAVSNFGTNKKVTKMAVGMSNASKGGYSGTFPNSDTWSGTATSVTYYTSTAMSITSGNITFSFQSTAQKAVYIKAIYVWYESASTPLTSIGLSGTGVSSNAISIGSSDSTAHTINVSLTPSTATDQKVNIAHQSGTSGLFTKSASQITCSSGSGSFTITGTGGTSGSETFRISGNTQTSVYVDLVVTALDDSVTYYTVTFNSNGGSSSPAAQQVEEDDTFEFPSPGTKTHYSFDGWSSDGGTTKYAAGATSPAVGDDITYTAYWTENAKYTVTYSAGTHGTGSYAHTNQYGGTYTLLAIANVSGVSADSGYRFKNYTVGGVNKDPGDTFTLSAATTVTVNFEEQPPEDVLTSSVIPAAAVGSSTSSWGTASTFSDSTGAVYTGRFMGVSSSSFIGRLNDSANGYIYTSTVPSNMKLKSVSISSMTASKTVGVYAQSGAYTACVTDKSTALGTITPDSLTYTFDSNTSYNAICLRGHTSATEIGTVTITYEALAVLDSVTTSGQTASFIAGNKWSFGGTLTAHYTAGKADATVTPTSFKYGASGINPTTAGTAITTDTTLNHDTHNGKYIYVVYTEDNITKWASYQITVNYAAVTSVVINTHAAEIGLKETYDYTLVGVTVNTSYADPGYEWVVSGNTVSDDYTFDGSGLKSKDTEGTITLRCQSTADNSKYDELVVTVTGDPTAEFTPESVSGYVGKGTSVAFTYGNMDDTSKISVSSNNASVTVGEITASDGEGSVAITFVSAGSATLSVSYDGGSTLDSITVTVSTDSVTALTWSAPTIKVYSGATTTVSDASSWNVHYTMASGDYGSLVYGEYTLKLGGSAITLPHTWDASEDGKVLSIEYGGFASPTTSTVNVTQTLQAVMAPVEGEPTTSTLTFTEKYATGGATSSGGEEWVVESDGTESNFDDTKGIHYGTGSAAVQYIKLTTDDFASGTITKVVVNASTASGVSATAGVTVGGDQFGGDPQSLSSSATNYTFTGSAAADEIVVTITKPSSATKAIYCLSVAVTYVESSGTQNIANVAGHEAAQKAVVAFAKAMNAAFDNTTNCTEGVAAAWTTASNAYSSNIADNASLSADEKAYAKNLIKYATAQYTDNTDNDYSYCLERAMATYEACIQKHGQTAFMSDVRSVSASSRITPLSIVNGSGNTVAIIVIISMISLTAIGGYFFLRKRKENI